MRSLGVVLVGLLFMLVTVNPASAWFGKKKTQESSDETQVATEEQAPVKKAPEAKKTDKAAEAALKQKKEQIQRKAGELNNTEWQIELTPLSGKGKKETDVVTFSNNQVVIGNYLKKGFVATNYTVSIQDDGTGVWETMQSSEKAGTAFWRGEMDKTMQVMRGILSYQVDDKTKHDYSFISTARKSIPAPAK
ncbi:MAG TPA: hypothetical protein P5110_03315 [Candidatus Omnitrophota bacterium]|nr:hypothetical protein [Candidatus Omnitrophota bacterium]HRZ14519.1 hypothetical protein [Candidatus Omnitrophota bacterium]